MNLFGQRYRDWLVPYVEGTLDARRRAMLEARLAHDPGLAAEAEAERRVAARLRETAQATGTSVGGHSLWPAIQARLEPRRPSVRPLILVGGLSAATATLIGAALWGPLKPSAPMPDSHQVAVMPGSVPPVVVTATPPGTGRHSGNRPHAGVKLTKRPAVRHALPAPVSGLRRDQTQPQDLLASHPAEIPESGSSDGTDTTPKFAPGSRNFRLTGHEHPGKSETLPDMTPTDPGAATGNSEAPPAIIDPADTPPSHAEGTPSAPKVSSDGTTAKAAPTPRHRRHPRRRHSHAAHAPAASPTGHEGSTPGNMDAPARSVPPKGGVKPVD